ncbi:Trypsin [Beauveria bassiana]|uniref:Trypsin n=1 Tax=Beauveria bassiana TaxID=176275 RepID=A0A2N6NUJ9_BEABA|nr:Trypsin [Beauveria bassiana]
MQSKAAISLTFALSAFSAAAVTIDRRIVGGEDAKDGEFPSVRHDSGGVEAKVANRTSHPEYLLSEYDNTKPYANNDIGIIKLASPIKKSDKIDYASLPADGSDAMVGSMGTVAGWGVQEADWTFAGDVAEENLAKVTLPVHAREVCDKLEPSVKGRDTVLCIGGNGKSACRYDSGGGFFDDTTSQVVGVA